MATLPANLERQTSISGLPGRDPLVVIQLNSWAELERYRQEWDHLLSQSPNGSIFMTPEWLASWWRAYGTDRQLCALAFMNSAHHVVGLAPLYLEQGSHSGIAATTLRFVGAGSGDSDDLDFIVLQGFEGAVAEAFLDWMQSATKVDVCSLETFPSNSAIAQHLQANLQRRGWKVTKENLPHSFVDLPRTWADYLETLPSDFKPLLTRYPKRLRSRFSVQVSRCENVDELDSRLQTLFALHQMRWTGRGEPGAFSSVGRRDFYLRMATAFLQRGWLEFWSLTLQDEIVATQFCFRYRDIVYLLQEGFNPKYTAEKVGYALRAHVLQEMITTGARRYDFLGGDDSYKARYGSLQGAYLNLHFAGPSFKGRFLLAARKQKRGFKSWLKANLPQPLLALVRRHAHSQAAHSSNQGVE